jgi:hypothetical protein
MIILIAFMNLPFVVTLAQHAGTVQLQLCKDNCHVASSYRSDLPANNHNQCCVRDTTLTPA